MAVASGPAGPTAPCTAHRAPLPTPPPPRQDQSNGVLRSAAMRPGYLDQAKQVYYPFNYLLPSGLVFTFCGRAGFILDVAANNW